MTLVIIPSRLASSRLPRKPLQLIKGKPVIRHVVERALEADIDPVVATDSEEIGRAAGCRYVVTPELPCGTDRVAYAADLLDPADGAGLVVNLQGDMPFIDPLHLRRFIDAARNTLTDAVTAFTVQHFVEVVPGPAQFRRGQVLSHIGLYAFRRAALRRFAQLPQTIREKTESLEQLRAVGRISWTFVDLPSMPLEINTPTDLAAARLIAQ